MASSNEARSLPRILVVTANGNASNSYTLDWLDAFLESSQLQASHVDLLRPNAPRQVDLALRSVDGVVLLHTVTADDLAPFRRVISALGQRSVPLCVLVGNEVNLPWAPMSEKIQLLRSIEPEVIGTQLLREAGEFLYGELSGSRVISIPHATDPTKLRYQAPRQTSRPLVGTRSAKYLPILGDSYRESFFAAVKEAAPSSGWRTDFTSDRLERNDWQKYLTQLDLAAGTEAGSFYTSPDDALVCQILEDARCANSGLSIRVDGRLRHLTRRLPWRARQWLRTGSLSRVISNDLELLARLSPEAVYEQYFSDVGRSPVYTKALSSRHVEAAALGTPQLLLEGRYNDILRPGVDYISVSSDFSNLDDALEQARDAAFRAVISSNARERILDETLERRISLILRSVLS